MNGDRVVDGFVGFVLLCALVITTFLTVGICAALWRWLIV